VLAPQVLVLLVFKLESNNDVVRDCTGVTHAVHEEFETAREQLLTTKKRLGCVLFSSVASAVI
jgi:hypothetical protein